jgi:hypothetical protein
VLPNRRALAFAQRNSLGRNGEQPRLRRFTLLQLIEAICASRRSAR